MENLAGHGRMVGTQEHHRNLMRGRPIGSYILDGPLGEAELRGGERLGPPRFDFSYIQLLLYSMSMMIV